MTAKAESERTIEDVTFWLDSGYTPEAVVFKSGRSADRLAKMLHRAGRHATAQIFDALRQRTDTTNERHAR